MTHWGSNNRLIRAKKVPKEALINRLPAQAALCPNNTVSFQKHAICLNYGAKLVKIKIFLYKDVSNAQMHLLAVNFILVKKLCRLKNFNKSIIFNIRAFSAVWNTYRVEHMFGNAVFCWLWVSWLTEAQRETLCSEGR